MDNVAGSRVKNRESFEGNSPVCFMEGRNKKWEDEARDRAKVEDREKL